ncbi:MAG: hypothetical protein RLZZ413_2847, partial [Pseudomonadota bacterium]
MAMASKSAFETMFNENNQEFVIAGKLRPRHEAELEGLLQGMVAASAKVRGTFYLNVKRLAQINNIAFCALHRVIT